MRIPRDTSASELIKALRCLGSESGLRRALQNERQKRDDNSDAYF